MVPSWKTNHPELDDERDVGVYERLLEQLTFRFLPLKNCKRSCIS